jgi:hypothetical protein
VNHSEGFIKDGNGNIHINNAECGHAKLKSKSRRLFGHMACDDWLPAQMDFLA